MSIWWMDATRGFLRGAREGGTTRKGVRILLYHGVIERITNPILERNFHIGAQFRDHVRLLRRCRVASVAEALQESVCSKESFRPPVIITFDDGYANNLLAAELLQRYHLPWTLFVTTGALGRERCLWTTELALLLLFGEASQVEAEGKVWLLRSREERERAFHAIRVRVKRLPAPQRRQSLENLRQQFPAGETERLLAQFPSVQMLTWDEVRQLAASGVDIQSHGVEHEIHHADQLESVRRWELATSKQEIERRVGGQCIAFAYPNGDFLPESERELRESGYQLGLTTVPHAVTKGSSPYYLPRIAPRNSLQSFAEDLFWEAC